MRGLLRLFTSKCKNKKSVTDKKYLLFRILLLNDKPLMGEHVNTRWQNIADCSITLFVILMSTLFGVSVLFPSLFGQG